MADTRNALAGLSLVVGLSLALLLVAGALFAYGPLLRDYTAPEPFTVARWQQGASPDFDTTPSRWRMRYSLVRQHRLEGLSRAEVERLLGPSEGEAELVYSLGPSGRGVEYGSLTLHLDRSGHVTSYSFSEH